MNMQSAITAAPTHSDVIHSIGELLTVALHLLDELEVPADIGANLDLTIQKLADLDKRPARPATVDCAQTLCA